MPETEKKPQAHEGYASGSKTLDMATWTAAVAKLLAATKTEDVLGPDKKKTGTKASHETDPSDHQRWTRKTPRPEPLPRLVEEHAIARGAKVLEHELTALLGPEPDLDMVCYHNARSLVLEARREHAHGLALREPKTDVAGNLVLECVFVK